MRWLLQLSFAVMAAAVAWRGMIHGDSVFSFLFLFRGWSERAAMGLVDGAGVALLVSAVAMQFRRGWPALIFVSLWMAALAAASMCDQPATAALVPGTHAIRVLAPLALVVLARSPDRPVSRSRVRVAIAILRLTAAATFVCHGLQALTYQPAFLDYLFGLGIRLGVAVPQELAEHTLVVIGGADIAAGSLLLFAPLGWRVRVALYMSAWGMVTALARTVHSGYDGLCGTAQRLPHAAVPLALFLYWRWVDRPRTGT